MIVFFHYSLNKTSFTVKFHYSDSESIRPTYTLLYLCGLKRIQKDNDIIINIFEILLAFRKVFSVYTYRSAE